MDPKTVSKEQKCFLRIIEDEHFIPILKNQINHFEKVKDMFS
jgi:hypothetical protein